MSQFFYEESFPLKKDNCLYRKLPGDFVHTEEAFGRKILRVFPEALEVLAKEAFNDISFYLRPAHMEQLRNILEDPESSDNDKFVAHTMIMNQVVAAEGELPSCQDTGTAIVFAEKGEDVYTGVNDPHYLSKGIFETYREKNLRYSQISALSMFSEKNTGNNLPAQIDIHAVPGREYRFLFVAKGGGSANKTFLYQESKSLLTEENLTRFIKEKIRDLGSAACPPYHLAVVIGGSSAEATLTTVKKASAGYYDELPGEGNEFGQAFRDTEWEKRILDICQKNGIGAQFGGKYLVHDVKVIRLPRHAASCPVGIGVSCSADRNIKARITEEGIFLEQMERNPSSYLPPENPALSPAVQIDLDQDMDKVLKELSKHPVKTRLSLNGTLIVARDMAHARIRQMLEEGKPMPEYMKKHPVYYAGPAKKPAGLPSGSFGPTTAGRMDSYVDLFQQHGGSLIMLAKGNRSVQVSNACKKHGGFYLGSIGGPAAILAKSNIKSVEIVDFEELGMEAVRKIVVENFPAFIVVDNKGNDFYAGL